MPVRCPRQHRNTPCAASEYAYFALRITAVITKNPLFDTVPSNDSPCDRRTSNTLPFPGRAAQKRVRAEQRDTATAEALTHVRGAGRSLRAVNLPTAIDANVRTAVAKRVKALLADLAALDDLLAGDGDE